MTIFGFRIWARTSLLVAAVCVASAASSATASTEPILRRMTVARAESRARLRPFEVVRAYELFGKQRDKSQSEVTAEISYTPEGIQHYTIHKLFGVSIGETLVRRILEGENAILGNRAASEISEENYIFHFVRADTLDGRACYLLALLPKRKDPKLVVGTAWIDASTYLVRRVEGQLVQPASWWIRNVHIVLDFREIHGMWLQTGLLSTADVRLIGPHTMVSHDVEYRLGDFEAAVRKPGR